MAANRTRVEVTFYAGMKNIFGEKPREVVLEGPSNLKGLMSILCDTSERKERIFDGPGRLRSDLTILINGRNVNFLGGAEAQLSNGDKVAVFTPVMGG